MFIGFTKKISLNPMVMALVWWLTLSNSHYILHAGTLLRGDHLGVEEVPAIVLCSKLMNIFKFTDQQHTQCHYMYQKLTNYI